MLEARYFWPGTVLVAVLYLALTALEYPVVIVLGAVASGLACGGYVALLGGSGSGVGAVPSVVIMAVASTGLGAAFRMALTLKATPMDVVGIVLAVGSAWGVHALRRWTRTSVCATCKGAVPRGGGVTCPRCQELNCAGPSCWNAKHFRCRLCDDRGVVLFPITPAWWSERLGVRVGQGACSSCYKESHETDLRACGQCRWPMCCRCWDHHNGICSRCGWVMPDLPRALWPLVARRRGRETAAHGSGRGAVGSRQRPQTPGR